ncbi:MAG: hypothetical protein ACOCRO_05630 [Halanaerobiales bacterium]
MKKAVSNVISTVLIISLVMFISVIIFSFSKNMIGNIQMSPIDCQDLKDEFEIGYTNYDSETNELEIQIIKNTNKEINKIDFILGLGDSESRWICSNDCGNCEPQNSLDKVYVIETDKPEKIKLRVNGCEVLEKNLTN